MQHSAERSADAAGHTNSGTGIPRLPLPEKKKLCFVLKYANFSGQGFDKHCPHWD
jgi:hypothetical protein